MKKTLEAADCPLFDGIDGKDFEKMLFCLMASRKSFDKDEIIIQAGGPVDFIGIVLSGSVRITKGDAGGNISILTELSQGEVFAEVFVCAGIKQSPVTVQACGMSDILFIDYRRTMSACPSSCSYHSRLIENMLRLVANKNLMLNQKIEILSKRSTREKLFSFFDAQRNGAKKFVIAYNREEMANYLCVDRSAMSGELCRMRDEGLIKFEKNRFEILY